MNFKTFPRNRFAKLFLPSFLLFATVMFSLSFVLQNSSAQQTKLNLSDVLIALRSKKVTLAERNEIVTEAVKQRGVTFVLTPEIQAELEAAGADKTLIDEIRKQSPAPKPSPTPTAAPVATPAPTPKPPVWEDFLNEANASFVKGDFPAAISGYTRVIQTNNKEPQAFLNRGMALYNQKNFDGAIADFTKAIELDPKDSMAFYRRGDAFERIGKLQNAADDYQKAVDAEADNEIAKAALQRLRPDEPKIIIVQSASKKAEGDIVDVGSLKDTATKLSVPIYPQYERMRRNEGIVMVVITLDEEGKVIEAHATSGPKSLRQFAEDAAKKSKFNPAKVNEKPVKSRGYVAYNFKAS